MNTTSSIERIESPATAAMMIATPNIASIENVGAILVIARDGGDDVVETRR